MFQGIIWKAVLHLSFKIFIDKLFFIERQLSKQINQESSPSIISSHHFNVCPTFLSKQNEFLTTTYLWFRKIQQSAEIILTEMKNSKVFLLLWLFVFCFHMIKWLNCDQEEVPFFLKSLHLATLHQRPSVTTVSCV